MVGGNSQKQYLAHDRAIPKTGFATVNHRAKQQKSDKNAFVLPFYAAQNTCLLLDLELKAKTANYQNH